MTGLDDVWRRAVASRVPVACWSVSEGGTVLTDHEPDRWFSSASMIKTFLAAVALDEVERGALALSTPLTLRSHHRTTGDGVLGTFTTDVELPLLELLRLMIAISDNTATNVVLEAVGGAEPVNRRLEEWGYGSRVNRPVGAALPIPVRLGMTSVAEHQRLVAALPADGTLRALLGEQQDRRSLARWVGEDVDFAHKTGTDEGVRHDAGVLRASGRELLVACFTDGGPREEWVDHPACVGMGLAMAWTAEVLELDVEPPPGLPPCPA